MFGLTEMHFHTSEISVCGRVPAAEGVRAYKKKGYDALVVTDHFHSDYFDSLPEELSWAERPTAGLRDTAPPDAPGRCWE